MMDGLNNLIIIKENIKPGWPNKVGERTLVDVAEGVVGTA